MNVSVRAPLVFPLGKNLIDHFDEHFADIFPVHSTNSASFFKSEHSSLSRDPRYKQILNATNSGTYPN